MEINMTLIMYAEIFMVYIAVNCLAMFLGNMIEHIKLPTLLDTKPFNCKKCLSTHSAWVMHTFIALCIGNWIYFICGIIAAVAIYKLIDHEDRQQFE